MYPDPAPPLVTWGIGGIAAAVLVLALVLVHRAAHQVSPGHAGAITLRAAGFALAWVGLVAALALGGVLANFEARPPPLGLFMVALLSLGLWLGLSRRTEFLVTGLPLAVLVGVQAFRLPLELVMHEAARAGVMPSQLSYSGYNFDIVTGIGATVLAPLIALGRAPRWAVAAWNVWGLACLVAIVVIAVLTAPFVRFFGDGSINRWVAYLPFTYLPAVLVVAAVAGHLLIARRLKASPEARAR